MERRLPSLDLVSSEYTVGEYTKRTMKVIQYLMFVSFTYRTHWFHDCTRCVQSRNDLDRYDFVGIRSRFRFCRVLSHVHALQS